MAQQLINEFTQFALDAKESLAGQIFTNAQLMVLQNLRAEYALKKLKLTYTPKDHQEFLQQEAELTGWINCLTYIADCHTAAQEQVIISTNDQDPTESDNDGSAIFRV